MDNHLDLSGFPFCQASCRRQYSKRLGAIEPVFGNITVNKGMNKFTLRGQEKVNTQWQMYCLVHNIEKLRNSLHLAEPRPYICSKTAVKDESQ
nr:transposase [Colwellia sp. MT41]